ncbi:unnamed protein product, partial [Symbiodinium sp. KB8]
TWPLRKDSGPAVGGSCPSADNACRRKRAGRRAELCGRCQRLREGQRVASGVAHRGRGRAQWKGAFCHPEQCGPRRLRDGICFLDGGYHISCALLRHGKLSAKLS